MKKQLLSLLLIIISSISAIAQKQNSDSIKIDDKDLNFTVMPYISYNRNLESMFGLIPMAMYRINKSDSISPKSLSGLMPVYTTNGSKFIGFFSKFHFAEDKWRITFFAGTGTLCSQFYMYTPGSSGFIDYATDATVIGIGVQRKIYKYLYGGLTYSYAKYNTKYENDIQPESETETNGLAVNASWDTKNDAYYPTNGEFIKLKWSNFPSWIGNTVEAKKINAEYNKYFSMRDGSDVIAARVSTEFGLGDIAFEQQVTIGNNDIRGYSEGKYRGDGLMAIQGEYRFNFAKRMGLVAFGGLATIYGSDTEDFNWNLYPGGGIGYRYQAFKSTKFNIGLDAAVGKDDWGVYFRIGEAFNPSETIKDKNKLSTDYKSSLKLRLLLYFT